VTDSLALELQLQAIPSHEQPELALDYKSKRLSQTYKPDFICFDKIIVEIKALKRLTDEHRAQVHNYLKMTGFKLGLLINFGLIQRSNTNALCGRVV